MESRTNRPLANCYTEWAPLELVCVGVVQDDHCAPFKEPAFEFPLRCSHHIEDFNYPLGQSHHRRIKLAQNELANFVEVLEGEMIQVKAKKEVDADLKREVIKMASSKVIDEEDKDGRIVKHKSSQVVRPSYCPTHETTKSPWWESKLQWGPSVPRDTNVVLGNCILESTMSFRCRYFDNMWYRDIVYDLWNRDPRVTWKSAPKPSMKDDMYNLEFFKYGKSVEERMKMYHDNDFTSLANKEVAFDAADLFRFGKDVLVRKGQSCNNLGLQWLRREFPQFRFHQQILFNDYTRHADEAIIPICGPTAGSPGIVFVHQTQMVLEDNLKLFKDNDWRILQLPPVQHTDCFCLQGPGPYLASNMLSISPKCCIIEEQEVEFYHVLEDLGMDVITIPFRCFPMFGGAIHCSTWDIRRDEDLVDFFPNQDYEAECKQDLNSHPGAKCADYTDFKVTKFNGIVDKIKQQLESKNK